MSYYYDIQEVSWKRAVPTTTQPYLAYKLTTIRLASRGTTLRADIVIRLNMEDITLITNQDIYTRTHEQQVLLTAQLH